MATNVAGTTRFLSDETHRNGEQVALAVDATAPMDALEIERATVAGFDWGSRTAAIMPALWPERCSAVVAVSGYLIGSIEINQKPLSPKAERGWWYQYYFSSERGRLGYSLYTHDFTKLIWQLASPTWDFDNATFDRRHRPAVSVDLPRRRRRAPAPGPRLAERAHDRRGAFLRRAVMTALGDDATNVVGLVYTAASRLDEGESVSALGGDAPPGPALANLTVDEHGFGRLPEDDFVGHFAADVDRVTARVMHTAQPVSMSVFDDVVGTPAWRSLPPYYYARLELFRIDGEAHRLLDLVSRLERLKLRP